MKSSIGSLVLLVVLCYGTVEAMRKQGIAIKGRLMCGGAPAEANSTKVRIVDVDTGPDPDDTLDEKFVDTKGEFQLNGYTRELTDIDPFLYIWHDCADGQTPCQRKVKFTIPKKYIIGKEPTETDWIDFGVMNLQSTFAEEKRECIS